MTPLVRATAFFPAAGALVVDVLERHPAALGAAVQATALAGPRAGRALSAHLAGLVTTTPMEREDVTHLLVVAEGTGLGRVRVALHRLEVAAARAAADKNPTTVNRADLANSLSNLGVSLYEVGERREALTVHREAIALFRELAAAEPARYTGDLTVSLSNLGVSLRGMGEQREALTTDREVVALFRELAAAEPARYTGDLTVSLSNPGVSLQEEGERQPAGGG